MEYVKINGKLYPATITHTVKDNEWDGRKSKSVTLEMDCETASGLFVDGVAWAMVEQYETPTYDDKGEQTNTEVSVNEIDHSEYCLAGDITDRRDGTITVKMGKLTDLEEAYEIMLGGAV